MSTATITLAIPDFDEQVDPFDTEGAVRGILERLTTVEIAPVAKRRNGQILVRVSFTVGNVKEVQAFATRLAVTLRGIIMDSGFQPAPNLADFSGTVTSNV